MLFSCRLCNYESMSNLATQIHVQTKYLKTMGNHSQQIKKISVDSFGETDK